MLLSRRSKQLWTVGHQRLPCVVAKWHIFSVKVSSWSRLCCQVWQELSKREYNVTVWKWNVKTWDEFSEEGEWRQPSLFLVKYLFSPGRFWNEVWAALLYHLTTPYNYRGSSHHCQSSWARGKATCSIPGLPAQQNIYGFLRGQNFANPLLFFTWLLSRVFLTVRQRRDRCTDNWDAGSSQPRHSQIEVNLSQAINTLNAEPEAPHQNWRER